MPRDDAAERAERLHREHTRRREQRQAPDGRGEVEQRDPHEHAPMRPAGAEPFTDRHRAALAGSRDAFNECALADAAHDDDGQDRQDDHGDYRGDLVNGEGNRADADRPPAARATAARATATSAARHSGDKPEQPEGFAGAGVVEPLSGDLADGHALLPVPGREADSLV
jgi:hypothetical protein